MKSIMQEASSVIKAIEKGWESAGKPKEFSVKVFEEPKKNFIGLTIQSAKVGIFFDDKLSSLKDNDKEKPASTFKKQQDIVHKQPKKAAQFTKPEINVREERQVARRTEFQPALAKQQEAPKEKTIWTPEMLEFVQTWLKDVLRFMNIENSSFHLKSHNYQLNVQFDKQLLEQPEKEQQLLRSFSLILIQTLRHSFKRPLRGFKIIMSSDKA